MTQAEFTRALLDRLSGIPENDQQKALDYYGEMIADGMEDGLSECEAVARLGSPQSIADTILTETPITKIVKERLRPKRRISAWEWILLILGSPVWVSVLIALAAVLFSVYATLWAVVISLFAATLGIAAGALGALALAIRGAVIGNFAQCALYIGAALICAGLSIVLFGLSCLITKGIVILSKKMLLGMKLAFAGKGDIE